MHQKANAQNRKIFSQQSKNWHHSVQGLSVFWNINEITLCGHDVKDTLRFFFLLVTVTFMARHDTNLSNTSSPLAEGIGTLFYFSEWTESLMWLIWIGKEGKNHCPRMSKSALDCAAAEGSRFAMHTACGSRMQEWGCAGGGGGGSTRHKSLWWK